MPKHRFKFFVAVHAFFMQADEVLLLKRANTGYMDGFFSLPAGHVDGGEAIETAMKREIREEVGIQIIEPLEPTLVMHRLVSPDEERIDYFFVIKTWQGKIFNAEKEKCSSLEWHKCATLPDNTIPYIKFALARVLEGKHFTEFDEQNL